MGRADAAPTDAADHLGVPMGATLARAVCVEASLDPLTLQPVAAFGAGCTLPPPAPLLDPASGLATAIRLSVLAHYRAARKEP